MSLFLLDGAAAVAETGASPQPEEIFHRRETPMPALGLSQNRFKIGQQHTFKVFGDALDTSNVTDLTPNSLDLVWQNVTTVGNGQHHVTVRGTLVSTAAAFLPTDTIGDLTVTVTDAGVATTTTFSPVTYET
jgi:hypothetical protein